MPHRQAAQEKHTPASLILEGKFKIELKKKLSLRVVKHNESEKFFFRDEYYWNISNITSTRLWSLTDDSPYCTIELPGVPKTSWKSLKVAPEAWLYGLWYVCDSVWVILWFVMVCVMLWDIVCDVMCYIVCDGVADKLKSCSSAWLCGCWSVCDVVGCSSPWSQWLLSMMVTQHNGCSAWCMWCCVVCCVVMCCVV